MDKKFTVYAHGLCCASVCSSLDLEDTTMRLNMELPTGINSEWAFSEDKAFADGTPNPCPCEDNPETHKHYLFNC